MILRKRPHIAAYISIAPSNSLHHVVASMDAKSRYVIQLLVLTKQTGANLLNIYIRHKLLALVLG